MRKTTSGRRTRLPAAIALATLLAAAFTVTPASVGPAQAGIEYPWCAVYSESTVGATNCGFSTYAQCAATLYGVGGMCLENPRYRPPAPPVRKPRKQHR